MQNHDPKDPVKIAQMAAYPEVRRLAHELFLGSCRYNYSYNFTWLGRPIIQYPQDIMAMQEIIWQAKPEVIIETGIAHGGSLIFHASMLELIGGTGRVLGIDVDIRPHNRAAIGQHPMSKRITMLMTSQARTQNIRGRSAVVQRAAASGGNDQSEFFLGIRCECHLTNRAQPQTSKPS
jgi:cephalosporin hydroxylase